MTTGEPLIVSGAMKPLPTLTKPLRSVDIATLQPAEALRERTDSCTVPAAGVVGEAMVAFVLADAYRRKFGGDHIDDVRAAVARLPERIGWTRIGPRRPRSGARCSSASWAPARRRAARELAARARRRGAATPTQLIEAARSGDRWPRTSSATARRRSAPRRSSSCCELLAAPAPATSSRWAAARPVRARARARSAATSPCCSTSTRTPRGRARRRRRRRGRWRATASTSTRLWRERAPLYEGLADAIVPAQHRDALRGGAAAPRGAAPPRRRRRAAVGQRGLRRLPGVDRRGACSTAALWPLDRARLAPLLRHRRERRARCRRRRSASSPARSRSRRASSTRRSRAPSGSGRRWRAAGMTRADHVVALGGGVVGDLAGFCAATYQRGIAGRAGADDARRPGRLRLRRQDRRRPARRQELRRRLPPAGGRARRPADAATRCPRAERAAGYAEVLKTALIAGGDAVGARRRRRAGRRARDRRLRADQARDRRRRRARRRAPPGAQPRAHGRPRDRDRRPAMRRYRHGEAVGLGLLAALGSPGSGELRERGAPSCSRRTVCR